MPYQHVLGRRQYRAPRHATPLPPPPPLTVPSWVPNYGEVVTYTQGGGVLLNNARDTVQTPDFAPFYSIGIFSEYSGSFKSPTLGGPFGGQVFWGGGHSATNNSMIAALRYTATSMQFIRLLDSPVWAAGEIGNNSAECDATYLEALGGPPVRVAAGHSYGCGDIINGYLYQVANQAVGYNNWGSALAAHRVPIADITVPSSTRSWERLTNETGFGAGKWTVFSSPLLTRYVPAQNRIYAMSRGGGAPYPLQWYDLATNQWVTGSGTGFNYANSDANVFSPETGQLIHVPGRELLLGCFRLGGNLVIEWMDVSVPQPTLGGSASLSQSLALPVSWQAICWCSRNNRILVFGVTGNTNRVYEITIPTSLGSTWTVDNHVLPNGATIVLDDVRCWKKIDYEPQIDGIVIFKQALETGADSLQVYRPRLL